MFDLLLQFAIELARALLVDVLSGRIRGQVRGFCRGRRGRSTGAIIRVLQRQNRERLFHRLHTENRHDP